MINDEICLYKHKMGYLQLFKHRIVLIFAMNLLRHAWVSQCGLVNFVCHSLNTHPKTVEQHDQIVLKLVIQNINYNLFI